MNTPIAAMKLPRSQWWTQVSGFTLIYLAFGAILLVVCCNPNRTPVPTVILRPFAYVGQFSYSIYLWHVPLQQWGIRLLHAGGIHLNFAVISTAFMALSLIWGVLAAKLIEFPVLTIRDRFFPSRTRSPLPRLSV